MYFSSFWMNVSRQNYLTILKRNHTITDQKSPLWEILGFGTITFFPFNLERINLWKNDFIFGSNVFRSKRGCKTFTDSKWFEVFKWTSNIYLFPVELFSIRNRLKQDITKISNFTNLKTNLLSYRFLLFAFVSYTCLLQIGEIAAVLLLRQTTHWIWILDGCKLSLLHFK